MAWVGFRAWRTDDDGLLYPLHHESTVPWDAERATARCAFQSGGTRLAARVGLKRHEVPDPSYGCGCGIYSVARPELVQASAGTVVGAIQMWGGVTRHEFGYRCLHARPFALALAVRNAPAARDGSRARRNLVRAARRYGATVVPSVPALLEVAREYGEVPELDDVTPRSCRLEARLAVVVTDEELVRGPPRPDVEAFIGGLLPGGWVPLEATLVRDQVERPSGLIVEVRTLTFEAAALAATRGERRRLRSALEALAERETVTVERVEEEEDG